MASVMNWCRPRCTVAKLFHTLKLFSTWEHISHGVWTVKWKQCSYLFISHLLFSFFFKLLCSGRWRGVVEGVGFFLLFVVVTALNLICNGYQLVGVFTIANGENKSVCAVFIIWLTFILSLCVISLIMRGFALSVCLSALCTNRSEISGL